MSDIRRNLSSFSETKRTVYTNCHAKRHTRLAGNECGARSRTQSTSLVSACHSHALWSLRNPFAERICSAMSGHVYKKIEITGTSQKSMDDAIQNAIEHASKTIHGLRWFEVVSTRGDIIDGKVDYFQVTLKIGFTLDK